jgi:hypothetical protein
MTYRIVTTLVLLLLAAAAVMLAPGKSLDETTQSVPVVPTQQAPMPAQKSEDDALKGFKIPN